MSKIILAADIHMGVPGKLDDTLWALNAMRAYAIKHNIGKILVLGDLFHDRVNLKIDVLSRTFSFFQENTDIEWLVFPGNHDLYMRNSWEINSLKPLNTLMTVIDTVRLLNIDGSRFWVLPFVHFETAFMKVLGAVEEKYEEGDVLLTHIGVKDAKLNECFLLKSWSIVEFGQSKFDRVFTGHFHCHQQVGRNVWYPGSIIPFRFDEGMAGHGFFVYDTVTRDHEFIDIMDLEWVGRRPPDYLTITDEDVLDNLPIDGNNIRVHLGREYSHAELHKLRTSLTDRGALVVAWMRSKAQEIEIISGQHGIKHDHSTLFERWVAQDKPKNLDHGLLTRLNTDVVAAAKDILVDAGDIEDQDA